MAVSKKQLLKQTDCQNAFCHVILPKDEVVVGRPPAGCPVSKPNTIWKLNKTLYCLHRLPLHWFNHISAALKAIGLSSCPNASCLFMAP
eukprot:8365701-Ditylum_brightwellii.AAC.1